MLIRISLILAILAALGAGTLGYLEVSQQIPQLQEQRDTQNKAKHHVMDQLKTTNTFLVQTKAKLAQTQQELADTQSQRDKAKQELTVQIKRADDLNDKLTQTTKERNDAQDVVAAYKATGYSPEQISKLGQDYKKDESAIVALNEEKQVLLRTNTRLSYELDQLTTPNTDIKLRADLRGKIVVVDPKWQFVVLDVGEDQGVIINGELLVSRDGKLVSKVVVRSVEKDRCIANIVPGWSFGPVAEGDQVIPAHPAPAS